MPGREIGDRIPFTPTARPIIKRSLRAAAFEAGVVSSRRHVMTGTSTLMPTAILPLMRSSRALHPARVKAAYASSSPPENFTSLWSFSVRN